MFFSFFLCKRVMFNMPFQGEIVLVGKIEGGSNDHDESKVV